MPGDPFYHFTNHLPSQPTTTTRPPYQVYPSNILHQKESPLIKHSEHHLEEGFWRKRPNPEDDPYTGDLLPYPYMEDQPVDPEFLQKLENIQPDQVVIGPGEYCRLCYASVSPFRHYLRRNYQEFHYSMGLLHYYQQHNVHPSPEFYQFIMESSKST